MLAGCFKAGWVLDWPPLFLSFKPNAMQTFLSMPLLSLKPFVALLAVVNPLACLPFFIHYTHGFDTAQRKKTIGVTSLTVLVVLACCALLGLRILQFFGISLASFQVGGGLLLMISALNMLNAQPAEAKTNVAEASYAASQSSVAVVPLAIPLLTEPASMSTMVIFAERTQNMLQMVQLLCYAAVVAAAVYVSFNMAPRIARVMGRTGINVMTRLMGLILAAMSVEVVSEGLKKIFPLLAGS